MSTAAQPLTATANDPTASLRAAEARAEHLRHRLVSQLDFVAQLARFHPAEAPAWARLADEAAALLAQAAPNGVAAIEQAVARAEALLAPIAPAAKAHTIHCVGHAHIDMNWMWGWPETVAVVNDTMLTMLKLMDEFPGFTLSQSQASIYEIMRHYHPGLLAKVRQRIHEGRFEVTASHWVEGDKNIAGGEALCRHLLRTREFMREHFALAPEDVAIDWSPDTFGHARTIPGIDARGGVKHYYMMRSGAVTRPIAFWWQGPDGSRVLVYRDPKGYNGTPETHLMREVLDLRAKTGSKDWLLVYGVGDHGGGPTRRDLRKIIDMDSWPVYPRWSFSTTKRFFAALEQVPGLPVLDHELNYEYAGCYTSQSSIKRNNRLGENALAETDTAVALAAKLTGAEVPAARLARAWEDVLFSHFHDILPGSGVRATREYNGGMTQRVLAEANALKTDALRAIAARVATGRPLPDAPGPIPERETTNAGGGAGWISNGVYQGGHVHGHPSAAVVFNPVAWARQEVATLVLWEGEDPWSGRHDERSYVVRRADGTMVPTQRLNRGHSWGHNFVELAFPVAVGGLGWQSWTVAEGSVADHRPGAWAVKDFEGGRNHPPAVVLPSGRITLENEHLRVRFDKRTGGIVSLVDKASGTEFADPTRPTGILEYIRERPYPMSAWIIGDTQERRELAATAFDVVQEGPHLAAVRSSVALNDSRLTVTYTLAAGSRRVDIAVAGRWLERGSPELGTPRLALRVPLALAGTDVADGGTFRCEVPLGSVARDELPEREIPALRWIDLTGTAGGRTAGCAVLNDSKYGHSRDGDTLRVSLIRSSYDPDPLPEIGDHQIGLALVPHVGGLSAAELTRHGAAFNHPLQVVGTSLHEGPLPAEQAGARCDAPDVVLTQLKPAEREDALVLRLVEMAGTATTATVRLAPELAAALRSAVEVDLLERPLATNGASLGGDVVTVQVPAYGIVTVLLRRS